MRTCCKCKIEKELTEYYNDKKGKDNKGYSCIQCTKISVKKNATENSVKRKEYRNKYELDNKEALIQYRKIYHQHNKDLISYKTKLYRKKNAKIKSEKDKIYREANRDRLLLYFKDYYQKNKDKRKESDKIYRQNTKQKINNRALEKRKSDPVYKLSCSLRCMLYYAFKNKGYAKNTKSRKILGCDYYIAKSHIEAQFIKGMSWENRSQWHIDHIIPLASAKTEQDVINLCHYTNLQPLWIADNQAKGKKMPHEI